MYLCVVTIAPLAMERAEPLYLQVTAGSGMPNAAHVRITVSMEVIRLVGEISTLVGTVK